MTYQIPDPDGLQEAEDAFYESLRNADLNTLMEAWAQDDDVVCIHPDGVRLVGLEAVRSSWEHILRNGGLNIRAVRRHCTIGATICVDNVIEEITVTGTRGVELIYCYATNAYINDSDGWRMILHHASAAGEHHEEPSSGGEILH